MRSESEFTKRFGCAKDNAGGSTYFETFGEEYEVVTSTNHRYVWAIHSEGQHSMVITPLMSNIYDPDGYVIVTNPITDEELSSGEWSEVLWFDGCDMDQYSDGSGTVLEHDPTDTTGTDDWFARFGELRTPDDILSNGNDDANWSFDDLPLVASTYKDNFWTVVEDEASGDLSIIPGLDKENGVNFLISSRGVIPEERKTGQWDSVLWYSNSPESSPIGKM